MFSERCNQEIHFLGNLPGTVQLTGISGSKLDRDEPLTIGHKIACGAAFTF